MSEIITATWMAHSKVYAHKTVVSECKPLTTSSIVQWSTNMQYEQ